MVFDNHGRGGGGGSVWFSLINFEFLNELRCQCK
jgi:hypothetical protein